MKVANCIKLNPHKSSAHPKMTFSLVGEKNIYFYIFSISFSLIDASNFWFFSAYYDIISDIYEFAFYIILIICKWIYS